MIPDPTEVRYDLSGNVLLVNGDLGQDEEAGFEEALGRLLKTGAESMIVDLAGVRYLNSSYVRHVAMLITTARQEGRSVTVRARGRAVRILKMGGLDKLATVEVVGNGD